MATKEKPISAQKLIEARVNELLGTMGAKGNEIEIARWRALYELLDRLLVVLPVASIGETASCEACGGSGSIPNGNDEMACGTCAGSGRKPHPARPAGDDFSELLAMARVARDSGFPRVNVDPAHVLAMAELAEAAASETRLAKETIVTLEGMLERGERPKPEFPAAAQQAAPIPMYLTCPRCSARHVDEGEFATKPHHTHSCQSCGLTWRPAVCATVGVEFLPGFKNEPARDSERAILVGSRWKGRRDGLTREVLAVEADCVSYVRYSDGSLHCGSLASWHADFEWLSGVGDPAQSPAVEPARTIDPTACYCSEYQSSGCPCLPGKCPNVPKTCELCGVVTTEVGGSSYSCATCKRIVCSHCCSSRDNALVCNECSGTCSCDRRPWNPLHPFLHREDCRFAGGECRGCERPLLKANRNMADGCPCNSPRGINHGLVPPETCTCDNCDPKGSGSSRYGLELTANDRARIDSAHKRVVKKFTDSTVIHAVEGAVLEPGEYVWSWTIASPAFPGGRGHARFKLTSPVHASRFLDGWAWYIHPSPGWISVVRRLDAKEKTGE